MPTVSLEQGIAWAAVRRPFAAAVVISLLATILTPSALRPRTPGLMVRPAAVPPMSFVQRAGTGLTLGGAGFRFDGMNMYAAVAAPCWYGESLAAGLNAIGPGQEAARVFAFQRTATTAGVRDWTYMDAMVNTFRVRGQRVIMVLTDQWSGQPCADVGADRSLAWYQGGYKTTVEQATSYRTWVGQVVARYAGNPAVMAWQLVNEGEARNPDGSCSEVAAAAALRGFADDVGGLIKSIDPNHLVSLGTVSGECGSDDADYAYVNAAASMDLCDFHDYKFPLSPMGDDDARNGLQVSLSRCRDLGKPLFIGELGIEFTSISPATTANRALLFDAKMSAQFAAGSVGEVVWCWSNTYSAQPPRDMEVAPGDPAIELLSKY
jgi:mannan endo-1,4-beta-mannosidase